jgi:hypothetical protein
MRAAWFGTLLFGAVFAIAGCRGGSGSIPSTPVSNDPAAQPEAQRAAGGTTGTIVIVLPTIVAPKPLPTPIGPGTPYYLSSGTRSISGSFGKTAFGPIDISASGSNCSPVSGGGRSCTIRVPVQSGTGKLTLATYGEKSSFGRLAFVPKTKVTVLPGVLNYVKPLKWFGVATGVKITASRSKLTQFKPTQVVLTVTGIDGSGARIPETNLVYASGGGFSTVTTAAGAYNQSLSVTIFVPTPWPYNGRYGGKETFTATGLVNKKAVAASSVTVKIGPGNASGIGQIIAASVSSPYSSPISIVEFTASAVGDVAPLRTINGTGRPYGATSDGNFWMATEASAQQFDTLGDVLGSVPAPARGRFASASTVDASQNEYGAYVPTNNPVCGAPKLYVFAAGSFGTTISRQLTGITTCPPSELAVDGTGVLYAYVPPNDQSSTGTVLEFAPNTSGNVPPARTISNVFLRNLVGDAAGNLYALEYPSASGNAGPGTLVKFAPGATTYTTVLPSVGVGAFALDTQGNIYAEVPTSPTAFQIEEFLSGSTTPTRIIGGSSTMLVIPAGITVLP